MILMKVYLLTNTPINQHLQFIHYGRQKINNSLSAMIKLVFGSKNKIIKHQKRSFHSLKETIKLNFPEAPFDYSLSYLDEDKDQICLNSDEDLRNMFNSKVKIHKVYIKQSLSQTIVIDVQRSDYIEPSFDNISVIQQDKKEEPGSEKNFGKETGVKVELNPVQKAKVQEKGPAVYEEPKQQNNVNEDSKKQKVQVQTEKENGEGGVSVSRQKLEIQQIVKPVEIKPIQLDISPEKRVFSSVGNYNNKEDVKQKEVDRIVHRARIFEKSKDSKMLQKVQEAPQVHGVICSNCKDQFGILGIRYQCILCKLFNLCSNCQAITEHPHALLKVKKPQQAMNDGILIQKLKKEGNMPEEDKIIPADHFIPSIDKANALRILENAKKSYENGLMRTKNLLEQLFFKMEMSHKNPYQVMKPVVPQKPQTNAQKAQYLSDLVAIPYNQAMRFVNQYPQTFGKQQIIQEYLALKK